MQYVRNIIITITLSMFLLKSFKTLQPMNISSENLLFRNLAMIILAQKERFSEWLAKWAMCFNNYTV
jgi:hypothetical protein